MDIRHHLDALLLSIASSTDNFTVGVSTGVVVNRHRHDHQHRGSNITKDDLPIWVNASISVSNALGALAAGFVGASVRSSQQIILPSSSASASASAAAATLAPPMLAAVAFGYLAIQELVSYLQAKRKDQEKSSSKKKETTPIIRPKLHYLQQWTFADVAKLALPMTLNNLAGGVAGGAAGISPWINCIYAFLSSFLMMLVGFRIGKKLGNSLPFDPSLLSAALLAALCLLTIQEAME